MRTDLPGFTEDDYAALGDRILAEPDEREARVGAALRWFVERKASEPWTDEDFRTASAALLIAADGGAQDGDTVPVEPEIP